MSKQMEKLAETSAKLETKADAWLTKLVNFPYSWIPAAVVIGLAAYGAFRIIV